jgi:hypothetical protein
MSTMSTSENDTHCASMGSNRGYEDLIEVDSALQNDAARCASMGSNPPLNVGANTFQHYDFVMVDLQRHGGSLNNGKKRSLAM